MILNLNVGYSLLLVVHSDAVHQDFIDNNAVYCHHYLIYSEGFSSAEVDL